MSNFKLKIGDRVMLSDYAEYEARKKDPMHISGLRGVVADRNHKWMRVEWEDGKYDLYKTYYDDLVLVEAHAPKPVYREGVGLYEKIMCSWARGLSPSQVISECPEHSLTELDVHQFYALIESDMAQRIQERNKNENQIRTR